MSGAWWRNLGFFLTLTALILLMVMLFALGHEMQHNINRTDAILSTAEAQQRNESQQRAPRHPPILSR